MTDTVFTALAATFARESAHREYGMNDMRSGVGAGYHWLDNREPATTDDIAFELAKARDRSQAVEREAAEIFAEDLAAGLPKTATDAIFAHVRCEVWNAMGDYEDLRETDSLYWERLHDAYYDLMSLFKLVQNS